MPQGPENNRYISNEIAFLNLKLFLLELILHANKILFCLSVEFWQR